MSLTPPGIRASTKTTEFYRTIVWIVVSAVFAFVRGDSAGILVGVAVASSFIASRAIYKKNRATFDSAAFSGELLVAVTMEAIVCGGWWKGIVQGWEAVTLIGLVNVVYNLSRGFAKSVGVKTQVLMR